MDKGGRNKKIKNFIDKFKMKILINKNIYLNYFNLIN